MCESPILITGAARSGTSLTAGCVDACGAYGGRICGATSANKKGQFENTALRNSIIKPFLKAMQCDPLGQKPLPEIHDMMIYPSFHADTLDTVLGQGWDGTTTWYWKGAKLCLIWPVVRNAFPDSKWLIVRRNKKDIVNSCLKTHFMRKRKTAKEWEEWVDEHLSRFEEMKKAFGDQVMEVWPTKMVEGDLSEIKTAIKWLGLEWDQSAVENFVDVRLWSPLRNKR